ncbi:sensor histidine kinase [Paenibacillus sp. GCM10027626]|uniref:cache domain-containing sensor histidine kinase n=1 Tax=Paenibacillus sp. GCM10027626 TaxID=3273411 RepID=UPI0036425992
MFKRMKSRRLIKKVVLFVILFILIPMLLIFWFASNQASLAIKQQVGKALSELNKQNHVTLDRIMDSIDQNIVKILSSDLIQQWNDESAIPEEQRVKKYMATEKLLANYSAKVKYSLFVLNRQQQDYYFAPLTDVSASGVFFLQEMKERPWFEKAIQAGGSKSIELIDQLGFSPQPQKTIAYLRAVSDLTNRGKTSSVLVATEIENVLRDEMNAIALPDQTKVYLVDVGTGTVMVGPQGSEATFSLPDSGKQLLPNVSITSSHMYVYHDSPSYANRLVYEIPLNSLLGSHNDVQEIIQITALCYFIVILAFLLYFAKSILRPMAKLAALTRTYEPGKQMKRVKEGDRQDEIGSFYSSFYLMTERLNQLVKEKYVMEIKQKESELALMHSQITPHLLYNTLDSIYWYGIRGGVPEVADMVRDLSTLLRIGLSRGKEMITVREELEHVNAYLQLQRKRYNQSFHFHIVLEDELDECLLPKVIIQPLAENSILHGIGKMDGEGELWIRIRKKADQLLISVEDNGFRPVDLEKIQALLTDKADPDKGFGVRNVHKRIQFRFGNAYGLSYSLREERGLNAVICLPLIRSASELASYTET